MQQTKADILKSLDTFTLAYLEAMLWSSIDEQGGEPLDRNYGFSNLTIKSLLRARADCAKFQAENTIPEYPESGWSDAEMAGHDFWLTRNHHGVGFWDRGLGEIGATLTVASNQYPELDPYVWRGKVYI